MARKGFQIFDNLPSSRTVENGDIIEIGGIDMEYKKMECQRKCLCMLNGIM